jgi:MOSC domain-containing protein YiiM
MHEIAAEPGAASRAARTLRACIASILEIDLGDVPAAAPGESGWPAIGWFLDSRLLAAVPVRDPERFQWGGWWIARVHVPGAAAEDDVHVVMAGTPSGIVWVPEGGVIGGDAAIVEGFVVARPALVSLERGGRREGVVQGLYIATESDAPMQRFSTIEAVAGVGLAGDRYATGKGHFSTPGRLGQQVTLFEAEALEQAAHETDVYLEPQEPRRNIVTRGVDLNALVGRRFAVGDAELVGRRLAEPCSHLQRTTPAGTLRALVHRGGLRADILVGGTLAVGDAIRALD